MTEFFQGIFRTEGYHPHGFCYLWQPGLVWLHVVSDAMIGLAYLAIGVSLALFVRKGRGQQLPFSKMFVAFGIFIAACGATHFASIWTLWSPVYWFSGGLKAITAVASVFTAVALPALVPLALGTLATARVSERNQKGLEDAHRRLQEMHHLKTRFFANVSHELRTPLTLILGPVEQMLRKDPLDDADRGRLEMVERNAKILLQQVNDLLDVAKLEAGKMDLRYEHIDLARLTRFAAANFESLAMLRGLKPLRVAVPAGPVHLEADGEKIRRVLFNLLANAIKFTPAGGEVECTLEVRPGSNGERGERAVIAVKDSGPGVPLDQRDLIFEPYRQADGSTSWRPTGTGLGLAIVAEMVTLHGGSVRVDDSPLGGASFIVELPLKAPSGSIIYSGPPMEEMAPPPMDPTLDRLRIDVVPRESDEPETRALVLVVEDNPEMNRFVSENLRRNYRVVQAHDGKEGLSLAKELRPDLIVSDIMMPEMTGGELVQAVRTDRSLDSVPIILLSARADDDLRLELLKAGVQDYLTKPFSSGELHARVENWIAVKRTRDVLQGELKSTLMDVEQLAIEISTRKHELEEALSDARSAAVEAEKANRAKSDFLGIMSHELRTPLNAIFGYVDLLESRIAGELNEKQVLYAQRTRRSAEHLLGLVDEILTYARIEAGAEKPEFQIFDLRELIADASTLFEPSAALKSLSFRVDIPDLPLRVRSDPGRLRRVVLNLLTNAIKFTDAGKVSVRLEEQGGRAIVSVEDTGPGIPDEQKEAIFQPFWQADASKTRKVGGTGLGLSIARELTRLLGGKLELESKMGIGSKFSISVPLASSESREG